MASESVPQVSAHEILNGTTTKSTCPDRLGTFVSNIKMSTYNHSSSYNRTYERKVVEEGNPTTVRYQSHSPITDFTTRVPFSGFSDIKNLPSNLANAYDYKFGRTTSGSFHTTEDSISITLDVAAFSPEDLKVSIVGTYIVVEGKHAEKPDELGLIERHFIRKFPLPVLVNPETITSNLTSDGQLTIKADPPKPKGESPARTIPIKIVTSAENTPNLSQASSAPNQKNETDKL